MRLYCLRKMNSKDGQVYSVCTLQFSCFTKYNRVCSQNINKQNVNIADETLSRYHYTISKNNLKRRYRIRNWIPMFIGTPCSIINNFSSFTFINVWLREFGWREFLSKNFRIYFPWIFCICFLRKFRIYSQNILKRK